MNGQNIWDEVIPKSKSQNVWDEVLAEKPATESPLETWKAELSFFLKGLKGEEPYRAQSVAEYIARTIPYSAGSLIRGIITFPYEAGKLIYEKAKEESKAGGPAQIPVGIAKGIWENIEGLSRFIGEPIGVYGIQRLKERWYLDPIGSIVGILPLFKGLKGTLAKKGIAPETFAQNVVERVNKGETVADALTNEMKNIGIPEEQLPLFSEKELISVPEGKVIMEKPKPVEAKNTKAVAVEVPEIRPEVIEAASKEFLKKEAEKIIKQKPQIPENFDKSLLPALKTFPEEVQPVVAPFLQNSYGEIKQKLGTFHLEDIEEGAWAQLEKLGFEGLKKRAYRRLQNPIQNAARTHALANIAATYAAKLAEIQNKITQLHEVQGLPLDHLELAKLTAQSLYLTAELENIMKPVTYRRSSPGIELKAWQASKQVYENLASEELARKAIQLGQGYVKKEVYDNLVILGKYLRKKGIELPPEKMEAFVKGFINLDPKTPGALLNYTRQWIEPGFWQKLSSYWYNNVLYGIPSHLVNFTGNLIKGDVEAFAIKPLSAIIDIPLSKLKGVPRQFTKESILGYYAGVIHGVEKGILKAFEVFKNGFDPEELMSPNKWDIPTLPVWKSPIAQYTLELPTRALKAADTLFKGMWEEARKMELGIRKLQETEGLKNKSLREIFEEARKIAENDPNIIEQASYWGKWMTFNEAPGKFTRIVLKLRRDVPILTPIIPFVRIAGNLLKQGNIEYSPAGFIKLSGPPELAAQYARAALGTGLMTLGYIWYKAGNMTLGTPRSPGERQRFYDIEKKQPYSIKVGDKWFPIRWIEPFCYPFLIGAIIGKNIEEGKMNEKSADAIIMTAAAETGRMLVNASYLNGLSNLVEMPWGYRDPAESMKKMIENVAGGLIPFSALLRNITYALDPEIKEAKISIPETLAANIPGLSKMVEPRLTIFGEPVERPGGKLRAVLRAVPTEIPKDVLSNELSRLEINITFPSKKVMGIELDDEDYRKLKTIAGQKTKEALQRLVSSAYYHRLPDEWKKKLIMRTVDRARDLARIEFLRQTKLKDLSKYLSQGKLNTAISMMEQ